MDQLEFHPLPRPNVMFHGASTVAKGRPLIDVLELSANATHYMVKFTAAKALCLPGGYHAVMWDVTHDGEVDVKGKTVSGALLLDPLMALNKKRIQLCPEEPWGISFSLPGPVEGTWFDHFSTSPGRFEFIIQKRQQRE